MAQSLKKCLPTSLESWLEYIQTLHRRSIDLTLDRARRVAHVMHLTPTVPLITVAGTNGKGTVVDFMQRVLTAEGVSVGSYTSPHLTHYSERICHNGQPVDEACLLESFEHVESARGDIALTYFEFGTLAAMDVFRRWGVEFILLEVGLGGRLDATNIWAADVSVITSIDYDHEAWLGSSRESIAREKSGILRYGCPVVIGDPAPPSTLRRCAETLRCRAVYYGTDFDAVESDEHWIFRLPAGGGHSLGRQETLEFMLPDSWGETQAINATIALSALSLLEARINVSAESVVRALNQEPLRGRLQRVAGPVERILDVAHNPAATRQLCDFLTKNPVAGKTYAVFSLLQDKDLERIISMISEVIDHWYVPAVESDRACDTATIAQAVVDGTRGACSQFPDPPSAYLSALKGSDKGDRIVVFGSFLVVGAILPLVENGRTPDHCAPEGRII